MKTAISLPNETFERAAERAHELGISRSEFFARAADRYLEELDRDSLTQAINEALDAGADHDGSNAVAIAASHAALEAADDW
ncbi:MAG: ribbon-helix-helix protein, CopG family [Candidatus Dormibacteraeota bacterium]|nr:ribbon-helix-helix protein, CopG family [Candidatus Dormibacteraeota bacterium]